MMSSEIATSVGLDRPLVIVLLDNRGYGCIHRLQAACGASEFNNLLDEAAPAVDFVEHARALGAHAQRVAGLGELAQALQAAVARHRTSVIVIETDPDRRTAIGGAWWDVPVAEASPQAGVREAYRRYRGEIED